jgi:hypothetical protein
MTIEEGKEGVIDGEERNVNEERKYWHIKDNRRRKRKG